MLPRENNIVLKTSEDAIHWPTEDPLAMGTPDPQQQRIYVKVGGHAVGQVKRDVTCTAPNHVKVEDAN